MSLILAAFLFNPFGLVISVCMLIGFLKSGSLLGFLAVAILNISVGICVWKKI